MKRFVLVGIMTAAMAVIGAPKADAAAISGTLSLSSVIPAGCVSGVPAGNTCSPVNPVNGNALSSLNTATGLDFTTTGVLTPNVAGNYEVNGASGHFAPLLLPGNTSGTIKDFCFTGSGCGVYPGVPINTFELGQLGFSFDLLTVQVVFQSASNLILQGTGLFHLGGFDNTPGVFNFAISNTSSTFAFAASQATVPEPGSMILLGTGLLGLAAAARRMRKS